MEPIQKYERALFGIAYRMLGSVNDAQDIVQEAYLRYERASEVENPRGYLNKVVVNLCLDYLKQARHDREVYTGMWLPEPLETPSVDNPEARLELVESVSMAFMVLLEQLSPIERAVLLLRDVFDYDYNAIAEMLGKSNPTCRKHYTRAKAHLKDEHPRYEATPTDSTALAQQFVAACMTGDADALTRLCTEDVVVWSDSGGKVTAATHPVAGRERVIAFLMGGARRLLKDEALTVSFALINYQPSVVIRRGEQVDTVLVLETSEGCITDVRNIRNPDKLAHLQ